MAQFVLRSHGYAINSDLHAGGASAIRSRKGGLLAGGRDAWYDDSGKDKRRKGACVRRLIHPAARFFCFGPWGRALVCRIGSSPSHWRSAIVALAGREVRWFCACWSLLLSTSLFCSSCSSQAPFSAKMRCTFYGARTDRTSLFSHAQS